MSKLSIIAEFWEFIKSQNKWWLLPIVVVLVGIGFLLVFAQTSVLAPFIYALF
jgi:hypothetical protein